MNWQQNQIKIIGQAHFKGSVEQILLKQKLCILHSDTWYISYGVYSKSEWQKIFQEMVQSTSWRVYLGFNNWPTIIKQIQNVKFTKLKQIFFQRNNIQNIESLSLVKFIFLQRLNLNMNHINRITVLLNNIYATLWILINKMNKMSNIYIQSTISHAVIKLSQVLLQKLDDCKSLHKLQTPFLEQLFLQQNPITEIKVLSQNDLPYNKLKTLSLQSTSNSDLTRIINQDLFVVVKYCTQLKRIVAKAKKRIRQDKLWMMLTI